MCLHPLSLTQCNIYNGIMDTDEKSFILFAETSFLHEQENFHQDTQFHYTPYINFSCSDNL
jgi:hypothetical protein